MIERDELYDYPSLQPRKSSQAIPQGGKTQKEETESREAKVP